MWELRQVKVSSRSPKTSTGVGFEPTTFGYLWLEYQAKGRGFKSHSSRSFWTSTTHLHLALYLPPSMDSYTLWVTLLFSPSGVRSPPGLSWQQWRRRMSIPLWNLFKCHVQVSPYLQMFDPDVCVWRSRRLRWWLGWNGMSPCHNHNNTTPYHTCR